MKAALTPRKIRDKNNKLTTVWVKAYEDIKDGKRSGTVTAAIKHAVNTVLSYHPNDSDHKKLGYVVKLLNKKMEATSNEKVKSEFKSAIEVIQSEHKPKEATPTKQKHIEATPEIIKHLEPYQGTSYVPIGHGSTLRVIESGVPYPLIKGSFSIVTDGRFSAETVKQILKADDPKAKYDFYRELTDKGETYHLNRWSIDSKHNKKQNNWKLNKDKTQVVKFDGKEYMVNGLTPELQAKYDKTSKDMRGHLLNDQGQPVQIFNAKYLNADYPVSWDVSQFFSDIKGQLPTDQQVRQAMLLKISTGGGAVEGSGVELAYKLGGDNASSHDYSSSMTVEIADPKTGYDKRVVIMKKYASNFKDVQITADEIRGLEQMFMSDERKKQSQMENLGYAMREMIRVHALGYKDRKQNIDGWAKFLKQNFSKDEVTRAFEQIKYSYYNDVAQSYGLMELKPQPVLDRIKLGQGFPEKGKTHEDYRKESEERYNKIDSSESKIMKLVFG